MDAVGFAEDGKCLRSAGEDNEAQLLLFCEILHDFEGRHVDEDQGKEAIRKDQTVFRIFLRQGSDIDRGMEDTKQQTLPDELFLFVQDGMHL